MSTAAGLEVVVSATITPRDWFIDPRTGWPWVGILARREDDEAMVLVRRRAARELRTLRSIRRHYRALEAAGPVDAGVGAHAVQLTREVRVDGLNEAIAAIRHIFARPAPRSGHPDLASLGAASRDEGALTEAPRSASPGPAAADTPRAAAGTSTPT